MKRWYDTPLRMIRYAFTIFLGAFLLFLVQPMMGKYILPWFGGGPGVWTVCLLFFQTLLLCGYAYAHMINRRLSLKNQVIVHSVIALVGLGFLPIMPDESWRSASDTDPTWPILLLLGATIGLPYLALSSTAPLMQAWFNRTHPGVSPYRLYALSNTGSLAALLLYPLILEPLTARTTQVWTWSIGFACFAAMSMSCSVMLLRKANNASRLAIDNSTIRRADRAKQSIVERALWVLLPACASILLLSFTTRLSEEIMPMPLLWILPLAIYLISFIITFEWPRSYHRGVFVPLLMLSFGVVLLLMVTLHEGWIRWQVGGTLATLFVCCMVCHGEAYRLRPDPARLTSFYLAIALGGALGGAFVALIAPRIFSFHLESYIALFATFGLLLVCLWRDPTSMFYRGARRSIWLSLIVLTLASMYGMQQQHLEFHSTTLSRTRNFFGVLSLKEMQHWSADDVVLGLYHGRIIHGAQFMAPTLMQAPTTYYAPESGVGLVMRVFRNDQPRRIGVVGLGVGTVAAYARSGDFMRFYEINPAVVQFAQQPFTFVNDARSRGVAVEIVLGDARLSLERELSQQFDVLILDAFSSDSVPIHLLTKEAFEVYQRHLVEGGVILVHVSNLHFELHLPLMRLADELNWQGRLVINEDQDENLVYGSTWVLLTANQELVENPTIESTALRPREDMSHIDLWTDEYSNLLKILK